MAEPKKNKSALTAFNNWGYVFCALFVIVFCIFCIYPVLRTLYLSFTDLKVVGTANWIGFANYKRVIMDKFFWIALWNTVRIWIINIVLQLGLAFYKFKGNKIIFGAILAFMMIPGQLSLIGFYQLCTKMHLINTYVPLIIPAIAAPGTVFFLRQYILSALSPSLIEAARIDGASELYSFHRIVIPVVSPAVATMGIMAFIGHWNNYLLPMIIVTKNDKMTLPVMMATLRLSTDIQANQGAIYLSVAISVIPIFIVFACFSKYIISSVSAGAVKE